MKLSKPFHHLGVKIMRDTVIQEAIAAIEAMHTDEANTNRWNKLMRARSAEMNASPRGRYFIAKYGDPINQQKNIKKTG